MIQVTQYRLFNSYVIIVQIITSIGIPLLSQLTSCSRTSSLLLTIVSTHAGISLALEKAIRSQEKYRSYRITESAALDVWRKMVHVPWTLHDSQALMMQKHDIFDIMKEEFTIFVRKIEDVRDFARQIETYSGSKETDATGDKGQAARSMGDRFNRQNDQVKCDTMEPASSGRIRPSSRMSRPATAGDGSGAEASPDNAGA